MNVFVQETQIWLKNFNNDGFDLSDKLNDETYCDKVFMKESMRNSHCIMCYKSDVYMM